MRNLSVTIYLLPKLKRAQESAWKIPKQTNIFKVKMLLRQQFHQYKGRLQNEKTGYLVTSCKKVGGGHVRIILLSSKQIMTCLEGGWGAET